MSINTHSQNTANHFSDIGALWEAALDRYEQITGFKVQLIEGSNNLDAVLAQVQEKSLLFERRRHDGSKTDKFRSLVKESLGPVLVLGEVVVHATKLVFPPVEAIFAAAKYLIGVANTISAGYDKVSVFFQDLSSYLHQLKTVENKLPAIPQLQMAVTEVFASVLVLCGVCAKYVKINRFAIAFRSLVSSKGDELTVAFNEFHRMVKREQDVVAKATLAGVFQLKSDTCGVSANVSKSVALSENIQRDTRDLTIRTSAIHRAIQGHQNDADRQDILRWLSSMDFHSKQRAAFAKHEDGTIQWLLDCVKFREWAFGPNSTTLWCPGIPGAGKTIMMSKVVDHLFERTQRSSVAIAYVYCNYKDPGTHSDTELFSNIARQFVEQMKTVPSCVLKYWEKHVEAKRYPTTEERILLVKDICRLFTRSYILIDALDECPDQSRDRFLHLLHGVKSVTRLFITSRPHVPFKSKFASASRVDIVAKKDDIHKYAVSQIAARERLSDLVSECPALKTKIVDQLSQNAAGMFLLCDLQVHRLCECVTVSQAFKSLETLPARIGDLYDEAFNRIWSQSANDKLIAQRAVSYISCAKRPFTVDELRHVLSVQRGDTDLDEYGLPLTKILLSVSAGLIRVDEKTNMTALVHHTLQEYLEEHRERLIQNPEIDLAICCVTYLSFNSFASGPCVSAMDLERRLEVYPFLDYASHHWGSHAAGLERHECSGLFASLLKDDLKIMSSTQVLYLSRSKLRGHNVEFPRRRGPLHILAYWGLVQLLDLFPCCGSNLNDKDSSGWTSLHIAAQQGQVGMVRLLLAMEARNDLTTNRGESALYWAARNGHKDIVMLLLQAGASIGTRDSEGWTALDWATIRGHTDVVQAILSQTQAPFFVNEGVNSALILSAEAGNDETLQLLLQNGAEVDYQDSDRSTALMWAVPEGHENVVSCLLSNGANVNTTDMYANTPLHWAIPYERIAKLLIVNGAEIDAKNDNRQTALDWCAQDGQHNVLRLLLEHGADAQSQDRFGFTALHAAALKGHEAMVHLLADHGANPNLRDENGWTALHAAVIGQHKVVADFLQGKTQDSARIIDWVAMRQNDANRRNLLNYVAENKSEGSTAITGLRWAVSEGRKERVRALLESGAHINAEDVGGCTALTIGAYMGQEATVQLLLDYGADTNKPERNGKTALHVASEFGYLGIVKRLVENGADTNAERCSWTAILLAARNGHSEVVHYLATEDARVRAQDYHMRSAMHWAAMRGSLLELQTLVFKGAEIDVIDRWGRTPLMWAIENHQSVAAAYLLRNGAAPAKKAEDGSTALHFAAFVGDEELVRALTEQGANVHERTQSGFSALQITVLRGHSELAETLNASDPGSRSKKRRVSLESKSDGSFDQRHDFVFDDGGDQDDDNDLDQYTPCLSAHLQRMLLQS